MTRLVLCLALAIALCCCNSDTKKAAPSASVAAPPTSGPLGENDREIIRLQLELAEGEADAGARARKVAGVLSQLEKGRLPASWTETMFIVSKAKSVPMAAKIMWKTLIGKDDMDPLVAAACNKGQLGLENIERVMSELRPGMTATSEGLLFSLCRVKETGFVDDPRGLHHGALAMAVVAFKHLKDKDMLSDEEANALRAFVTHFSAYFQANRILPRNQRGRTKPTATPSASAAPTASASTKNRGP